MRSPFAAACWSGVVTLILLGRALGHPNFLFIGLKRILFSNIFQ